MAETSEEKEATRLAKAEAKVEKEALKNSEKKIVKFEDIDSSAMVNEVKAVRAFKAVFGGAKGGSAEITLVQKLAGEFPNKEELVTEVYKGLGGLLNVAKAKVNRINETKTKKAKASR